MRSVTQSEIGEKSGETAGLVVRLAILFFLAVARKHVLQDGLFLRAGLGRGYSC